MLLYDYKVLGRFNFLTTLRKDKLSPPKIKVFSSAIRAFFLTPFRGSMTVEAALVLPLFLFCMTAVIQYGTVMGTAVQIGTALTETGKSMAAAAYAVKYADEVSEGTQAVGGALSAVYAQHKVMSKVKNASAVQNVNLALSSFLKEEDRIDLVVTYQIRSQIGGIRLPGNFFLQRACIRGWTGRNSSAGGQGENGGTEGTDLVYITENGGVYHEDPDCTYLNPSVREIDADAVGSLRNGSGEKYYACELCGEGAHIYITNEGNRYHSSLNCSGLKRTVHEEDRDTCGLKPCSKCGNG